MRFSGRRDAISHAMLGKVTTRIRLATSLKPSGWSAALAVVAKYSARPPTTNAPVSSARIVASAREARRLKTDRGWFEGTLMRTSSSRIVRQPYRFGYRDDQCQTPGSRSTCSAP